MSKSHRSGSRGVGIARRSVGTTMLPGQVRTAYSGIRREIAAYFSSSGSLFGLPSHSLASGGGSLRSVSTGQLLASSAFNAMYCSWPAGTSSSGKIALAGHSGSHNVQSMHSSGSIARKFGPSWKQSTGHTSTQSVYLHFTQLSVTTKVIGAGSRVQGAGSKMPRPGMIAHPAIQSKRLL